MFHPTEFSFSPKSLAIRKLRMGGGGSEKISREKSLPHAEILENSKGALLVSVLRKAQKKMVTEKYLRRSVADCHKMIELFCKCAGEQSIGYFLS